MVEMYLMEYLVIDGYNIINAWGDVFDVKGEPLEDCRDRLLHILSNYQGYKNMKVIVVFDAHHVKGNKENVETFDNITVVYTKENETADNYIERFVYKNGQDNIIRVVTSDYLEQRMVLNKGGIRVTPQELKHEIMNTCKDMKNAVMNNYFVNNDIMSRIDPQLREKLEKMRRSKF